MACPRRVFTSGIRPHHKGHPIPIFKSLRVVVMQSEIGQLRHDLPVLTRWPPLPVVMNMIIIVIIISRSRVDHARRAPFARAPRTWKVEPLQKVAVRVSLCLHLRLEPARGQANHQIKPEPFVRFGSSVFGNQLDGEPSRAPLKCKQSVATNWWPKCNQMMQTCGKPARCLA